MKDPDEIVSRKEFEKILADKILDRTLENMTTEQLERVEYVLEHIKPGDELELWVKYLEDGTPYEENMNAQSV